MKEDGSRTASINAKSFRISGRSFAVSIGALEAPIMQIGVSKPFSFESLHSLFVRCPE